MDNNEENLYGTTLSHEPTKKGLKDRIIEALYKSEKRLREIHGKVFTYLKIRTFKDYSYSDMIDEGYIFMKYKQQENRIKQMEEAVESLKKQGADLGRIKEVEYELAKAKAKFEAIKNTMKGTKGFDFLGPKKIEEPKPVEFTQIPNQSVSTPASIIDGVSSISQPVMPIVIAPEPDDRMKQMMEQWEKSKRNIEERSKNSFRTSYSRIVKSERRHCATAVASTIVCGAAVIAIVTTLQQANPELFDLFGSKMGDIDEALKFAMELARQGIQQIKNINNLSQIGELLTSVPTRILIGSMIGSSSLISGIRANRSLGDDIEHRKALEEENYQNSLLDEPKRGMGL